MCGICGRVVFRPSAQVGPVSHGQLRDMAMPLRHRGPDSDGFYVSPDLQAGLGFRRLSIIDLNSGDQPISNEDGTVWIVFNGEIYNFLQLRPLLEQKGHIFRTQSDTEVIVHAYEEYGIGLLPRLRGMFAFGLWDEGRHRLLLARDRLGKKPLFYHLANGVLSFASELKSLLRLKETPRDVDHEALELFLKYGYIPAPLSIVQGVHKLSPSQFLLLEAPSGEVRVEPYWKLEYLPKLDIGLDDAADELYSIMNEAVRLRMVSDVPLGALLSGGVDSASVVGLMALNSAQPIRTFTIGFEEARHDERAAARLVAERYGTDHHEMVVTPDAVDVLSKLVWYLDEPLADSSAVPTFYVAAMARQHVKVVMNGDGGDESFAGYRSYRSILAYKQYQEMPRWLRRSIFELPLSLINEDRVNSITALRRIRQLTQRSALPLPAQFELWQVLGSQSLRDSLFLADYHTDAGVRELDYLKRIIEQCPQLETLDCVLRADILGVLPGDLLVKMDRMTMAHSLEARSPFLDQNVVEFAARLPVEYKFGRGLSKRLMRRAFGKLIPGPLLRRPKSGFSVPLADWLRGDLRALCENLFEDPLALPDVLDRRAVRAIWDAFAVGRDDSSARLLWALVVLAEWKRSVLQGLHDG